LAFSTNIPRDFACFSLVKTKFEQANYHVAHFLIVIDSPPNLRGRLLKISIKKEQPAHTSCSKSLTNYLKTTL